jgi:serine/threonine protein kinase
MKADSKIDIWSLGIILYRMLFSGAFPFVKTNKKLTKECVFKDILDNNLEIPKKSKRS